MEWRRIELVCGVLGGALGLTALGIVLFAPLQSDCIDPGFANPSGPSTCGSVSAVQAPGTMTILWLPVTVFGALLFGVVLFAVWHSLVRSLPALALLWVCTVLLCVVAALFALTSLLGVIFVPAGVLALGASIAGIMTARQPTPVHV